MNVQNKRYEGTSLKEPASFSYTDKDGKAQTEAIPPYIPSAELIHVVELMRILKRPLLIKGAPGSGKTRLSKAVAYELYGSAYRDYYFEWNIKSTSKAKDGLYTFDYLERLRDAQDKTSAAPGAVRPERAAGQRFRGFGRSHAGHCADRRNRQSRH
jgi:MoxR-like ATPase